MNRIRGGALLAGIVLSIMAYGQTETNYPYSRYGLGSLISPGTAVNQPMGGISAGIRNPLFVNFGNPASFSAVDTLSFVFDFGFVYDQVTLDNEATSFESKDLNFHHLTLMFPISGKIGVAAGVVPFSTGSYNIIQTITDQSPSYQEGIGEFDFSAYGNGGIHKAFLGTSVNLYKGLSLGLSGTYYFGNLQRTWEVVFADANSDFNSGISENYLIRGAGLDLGAQYSANLSENYYLNLGASYRIGQNWKVDQKYLQRQFSSFSTTVGIDTIDFSEYSDRPLSIPSAFTAGIVFGKKDVLQVGIDYEMAQWGDMQFTGLSDSLVNASSIRAGLQFSPEERFSSGYFQRIQYRLGGHLDKGYLKLNDNQINNFGIGFGLGLPVGQGKSQLNLSFEYGERGSHVFPLHKEKYMIFGVSINIHEYWFVKRKFD